MQLGGRESMAVQLPTLPCRNCKKIAWIQLRCTRCDTYYCMKCPGVNMSCPSASCMGAMSVERYVVDGDPPSLKRAEEPLDKLIAVQQAVIEEQKEARRAEELRRKRAGEPPLDPIGT